MSAEEPPSWDRCCYNYSRDLGEDPMSDEDVDCDLPSSHYVLAKPELGGSASAACDSHARQAAGWKWVFRVLPMKPEEQP